VEKVGIVAEGAPLVVLAALNGCAVNVAAAMMTMNPVVSRDVNGRVLLGCIAYCRTPRCAWLSRIEGLLSKMGLAGRRVDERNRFTPTAAVDAKIRKIGRDHGVSGMELAEPD